MFPDNRHGCGSCMIPLDAMQHDRVALLQTTSSHKIYSVEGTTILRKLCYLPTALSHQRNLAGGLIEPPRAEAEQFRHARL